MPRKLLKGGNYSREETILGNTVSPKNWQDLSSIKEQLCSIRYLRALFLETFASNIKIIIAKNSLYDCFYWCKRNLPNNFKDNFFQKHPKFFNFWTKIGLSKAIRAPFSCINEIWKLLCTSLTMKQSESILQRKDENIFFSTKNHKKGSCYVLI